MKTAQFWHHGWNWIQMSISLALILTGQTSVQTQNLFVLCKWTRRAGVIYNRHQGDIRFISWCPTAILQLASPISQPPSFLSCNFILNTNGYAVKRGRNNPRPTVNDSVSWMHIVHCTTEFKLRFLLLTTFQENKHTARRGQLISDCGLCHHFLHNIAKKPRNWEGAIFFDSRETQLIWILRMEKSRCSSISCVPHPELWLSLCIMY